MAHALAIAVALVIGGTIIFLNERVNLLSQDRFPTPAARFLGYVWLLGLLVVFTESVAGSSGSTPTPDDLAHVPFWSVFVLHAVLIVFLAGWWALTNRPRLPVFLNLHGDLPRGALLGVAIGVGGWAVTIAIALTIGLVLTSAGLMPENLKPSPMIPWLAAMPVWKKILIVLSAMTVEELFFRGWLQKRIGLFASTILFAVGHAGYGQPFMLIGILVISFVIGYAFYRTKNLVPCIVAHGVFDSIQLFIIVPVVLKVMPT